MVKKLCRKCHLKKPVGEFFARPDAPWVLRGRCLPCIIVLAGKRCKRCDGPLAAWTKYGICQGNPDCKRDARGHASASWRTKNPEQVRKAARARRAKNPEKSRKAARAWRAKNPEKVRHYNTAWRAKNPESVRERSRAWRTKNPEKAREYGRTSYAKHRSLFVRPKAALRGIRSPNHRGGDWRVCAECHVLTWKCPTKIAANKTGNFFCCREHFYTYRKRKKGTNDANEKSKANPEADAA